MVSAWRYRLFRVGKMPPALKSASTAPDVLIAAEGLSVRIHGRAVALPGLRSARSVQLAVGSVVLSPQWVMASTYSWVVLDTGLAEAVESRHTLMLDGQGMHLHVNVPDIYEGGRGTFDLHFRVELDKSVLA